jgi:hypothetical protein
MPGEGLTHGPPAKKTQAAVTTGSAESSGIPCAMVYVLYVISPGTGFLAPVTRATRKRCHDLDLSTGRPGPHDFNVRLKHDRRRAFRVHRSPPLRLVTIGRNAPLHRSRMAEIIVVICPTRP